MELIEKTRKYWKFAHGGTAMETEDGIKAGWGEIWFPRRVYETEAECEQWLQSNEVIMNEMDEFKSMQRIDKTYVGIKSDGIDITDRMWQKMTPHMSNPDKFEKENFRVFESWLANNFPDRDNERFAHEVLKSFNKSIVGKPKINAHQWGPPGDGRFFDSRLEKVSVDEALRLIGNVPVSRFRKTLEAIEERDGAIYFLVPTYYMLNITDEEQAVIRKIDAGITSDMSIGFRAPKKFAIKKDGEEEEIEGYYNPANHEDVLYLEYRNGKDVESEALEGSHVFLGAQYGARNRKSARMGGDDADDDDEELMAFKDVIKPYPNEHACRVHDPGNYTKFRRQKRDHDGKAYYAIIGFKEDGGSEDQAYRYPKNTWSSAEARSHCKSHNGIAFEPASGGEETIDLDGIKDKEIRYYCEQIDEKIKARKEKETKREWTTAYVNTFEDNCFAVVESTGDFDEEHRTIPKNARHLPHHDKGNGATGTGGTVDLPHLRNALARVGQIEPVTDASKESLVRRAKSHLIAHAKKEGIGDYETITNDDKEKVMEIQIESLDVSYTVNEENLEKDLSAFQKKVESAAKTLTKEIEKLNSKVEEFEEAKETWETEKKELESEKTSLTEFKKNIQEVFGEEINLEEVKKAKENADAYTKDVIEEALKYGQLCELISEDEVEEKRQFFESMDIKEVVKYRDNYKSEFGKRNEQSGVLPENTEDKMTGERKSQLTVPVEYIQ